MATSRRHHCSPAPESRAPPPSPVAGLQDRALDLQYYDDDDDDDDDDDELIRFLKRSRPVPKLTLPHRRIFPRDAEAWKPQEIDFAQLAASQSGRGSAAQLLRSAAETFGCMQIVNHGVPLRLTAAACAAAESAFRASPELKAAARSPERGWGFEMGDEEEFFWWHGGGMGVGRKKELARIWPRNYKDLCARMECFCNEVEKIARKIEEVLLESDGSMQPSQFREESCGGSMVCFQRHRHRHGESGTSVGPKNQQQQQQQQLLMLIRSWSCSRALSLHFCGGAPQFHVYSKRGWVRFSSAGVDANAIMVTIGDQLEARSGGLYKHVAGGKPAFIQGATADHQDPVSIAFHYRSITSSRPAPPQNIITVVQQVVILALLYHIMLLVFYGTV